MRALLVRFDAPLMSFGDVRVDARGPVRDHPGLGQVTGLFANALGYDHAEVERLTRLQERLRVASRCDRPGERRTDFQTVDLGQEFMKEGWMTRGTTEGRKGGKEASEGTHIRLRQFHNGRVQTLAVTVLPSDESPTLDDLAAALDVPARPLFLGRKPCIPSGRLSLGIVEAANLPAALVLAPAWQHRGGHATRAAMDAWWPEDDSVTPPPDSRVVAVVDERDWRGQVVVGRRLVRVGRITPTEAAHV